MTRTIKYRLVLSDVIELDGRVSEVPVDTPQQIMWLKKHLSELVDELINRK